MMKTKPTKEAATAVGWHDDALEEPKLMKNGSADDTEDD
jgi:hypothetical protein